MTAPTDPLNTVEELAAELKLAESTFYTWRRRGLGPKSMKLGRRVVYRRSDVEAWLAAQERATARGGVVPKNLARPVPDCAAGGATGESQGQDVRVNVVPVGGPARQTGPVDVPPSFAGSVLTTTK